MASKQPNVRLQLALQGASIICQFSSRSREAMMVSTSLDPFSKGSRSCEAKELQCWAVSRGSEADAKGPGASFLWRCAAPCWRVVPHHRCSKEPREQVPVTMRAAAASAALLHALSSAVCHARRYQKTSLARCSPGRFTRTLCALQPRSTLRPVNATGACTCTATKRPLPPRCLTPRTC